MECEARQSNFCITFKDSIYHPLTFSENPFGEMSDLTKELPVEILEMIFQCVSLPDLCMAVLVCRRWREVGETHKLWSHITVTVDKRNQSEVSQILRSRRMEAVTNIMIGKFVSISAEG